MSLKVEYLIGDLQENFYQLGRKEADDFADLELNLKKLLSSYHLLKLWQDLLSRSNSLFKRRNQSFFEVALASYAEGLERPVPEVRRMIDLIEVAAHYGQIRPDLKALVPGCSSVFEKTSHGVFHHRLVDFPLLNFFQERTRLYHSQFNGTTQVSWVGMAGMALAPLHLFSSMGLSLALHQKPGPKFYAQGELIYSVLFDLMFRNQTLNDLRKDLRIKSSQNKWGGYVIDKNSEVLAFDIEGPQHWFEKFELEEKNPLIFTNVPLKYSFGDDVAEDHFVTVAAARAKGLAQNLKKKKNIHIEDLYHVFEPRLDKGQLALPGVTVSTQIGFSYEIQSGRFETLTAQLPTIWKKAQWIEKSSSSKETDPLLAAWKELTLAQGHLDQKEDDLAYHHFQMAKTLCPKGQWSSIIDFYLVILEYKFAQTKDELGYIYKRLLGLETALPAHLQDHALLMKLRFEKRLKLVITSNPLQLKHPQWQKLWAKEKDASEMWLLMWKNLITPRFDLLDVFYPYQ